MRVLAVTSLYPTVAAPHFAAFMPPRLAALAAHASVELRLLQATFPLAQWVGRAPGQPQPAPAGVVVQPTPFVAWPGVARTRRPQQMLAGLNRGLHGRGQSGWDVVLGHFLYPDGVAAAALARQLALPLVLVAHGTDVSERAAERTYHAAIQAALAQAAGLITVSAEQQHQLLELGYRLPPATVIPCGYDPASFAPRPQSEARRRLGLSDGRWLVYVGALRQVKRVDVLLAALAELRDLRLALVGAGDQAPALADQARRLGLSQRLRHVGALPHAQIPDWLAAADAVVLSSDREGTPTVLVEALALGVPVVATAVGGIPELVGEVAHLAPAGDAPGLARAIAATLAAPPAPDLLRARVAHLTWAELGRREAEFITTQAATDRAGSAGPPWPDA